MNESDPLSQLRDIQLPEAVGLWPPAPGWWLLAIFVVVIVIVCVVWRYRQRQRNRYRYQSASELAEAWRYYQNNQLAKDYLLHLTQLLKRTAMTAYPALKVNNLHGQAWLVFLDDTHSGNKQDFTSGVGKSLSDLPYQRTVDQVDLEPLHLLCLHWLRHHRQQKNMVQNAAQTKSRRFLDAQGTA
jgi:cbb3-type cytochrome oxidase subunit 3